MLLLYFRTIKNLTLKQFIFRIVYIFKRKWIERFSATVTRKYYDQAKKRYNELTLDANLLIYHRQYYRSDLANVLLNKITFLNHTIDFGDAIGWNAEQLNHGTRLWKLNLHYHEFLVDVAHVAQQDNGQPYYDYLLHTINDWIDHNPIGTPGYGQDNWNSYALSLRIVAWIKIFALLGERFNPEFKRRFIVSLLAQVYFLRDNIEFDILGNHLFKNWKALEFASKFFNIDDFSVYAYKLYKSHLSGQMTKACIHQELSPMYTGIVLEDIAEVMQLTDHYQLIKPQILAGYKNLCYLINDDQYSFFNDSVNANEVTPAQLEQLFKQIFGDIEQSQGAFNVDGYVGYKDGSEHLIVDLAPVVLGSQGGHVQCDALSLEWFVNNTKILTNSGVYEYNVGDRRTYSRSTRAHNTVAIEAYEQSEVWGAFRLGRSATTKLLFSSHSASEFQCEGQVQYYYHKRPLCHKRTVKHQPGLLVINDNLFNSNDTSYNKAMAYFHFHPQFVMQHQSANQIVLANTVGMNVELLSEDNIKVEQTPFFDQFGREEQKITVMISGFRSNRIISTRISITHE